MRSINFYSDYRKFLSDFYAEKKRIKSTYSYRTFCRKSDLRSPSIFREVANGKRNLTSSTIAAFAKGLGLSNHDARFFENLVLFNQAKSEESRKKHLAVLRGLRYRKPQRVIPVHLYEYYEKWYHPVVRELAIAVDWKSDYSILAKSVVPSIKASEVRLSVDMMLRLGFLRKESDGSFRQTDPDITTGPEVNSLAVRQMNREFGRLGVEAIDRFPPSQRDISSLVMGIPLEKLPQIKTEIAEFRRRLAGIANGEAKSQGFYTLVVEFFPVGRSGIGKEGTHD